MQKELECAITASKMAGEKILSLYSTTSYETKIDGSPVTIADHEANTILFEHLTKTNIPILSEESTGVSLPYPERLWIIDPLDGTKDFIKKTGDFSVMIGLIEQGRPVVGVIYAPAHDALYFASRGNGAYMIHGGIKRRLTISPSTGKGLRGVRSRTHHTQQASSIMEKLHAEEIVRGGMGTKATLICESFADFFFYFGSLGEWDMCAPEIITSEAGGRVTDMSGNLLEYGTISHSIAHGAVFSNGMCHDQVLEAINSATLLPTEEVSTGDLD